jgi:SnoaL-like domain
MSNELLLIEREIHLALCRFTRACDERDWAAFETVLAPDISMEFPGFFALEGRDAVIASIRSHLGGCGPSQHLIGNLEVVAAGKSAESRCYARAFHRGRGDKADISFEAFGEYDVRWRRLAEGWRAVEWKMTVQTELGDRSVLGPGD